MSTALKPNDSVKHRIPTRYRAKIRDEQVRRKERKFTSLAGLDDLRYRPAMQTLARVTLLLERSYNVLKTRKSLLNKDGELCKSVDVVRRLAETQTRLLAIMGLTPTAAAVDHPEREVEAAFERIEKMKRARGDDDDKS